ncbi:MAG: DUF6198 family protein [Bacteroidales bacterium]|nr:DUF6198 family protein [Bacteroidales bacterium]MCM1147676.1 DUF6198 family protein [Bacteroidales bacterium]MCM1206796.1 DUF6198 family protein [Bacillota bacterium]MCM1510695.1 DUF6198 family protein [Clostridium sp.]
MNRKDRTVSFIWQHILLLVSLYIMTFGVAVCVRSGVGSSVISVLPYVFESAGKVLENIPALTIGQYTYIMNGVLVLGQMAVLRGRFEWVQLFQLVVGTVFGFLIDVNMACTAWLTPVAAWQKAAAQFAGCTILGFGIAFEVRCGSVTMPGEGFPVAISKVSGKPFPKVKIMVDTMLVVLGVAASFFFFHRWMWHIIGVGTLFAMFYVGIVVRMAGRHIGWFDTLLAYKPGFRRYIYGLARHIYK